MSWTEEYADRGYVVFKDVLSHELIDKHMTKYRELVEPLQMYGRGAFEEATPERKLDFERALEHLHYEHTPTLRLVMRSKLRDLVKELCNDEPVYDMPVTGIWGPGAPPHRDTALVFRDPVDSVCRTWSALEDLRPDSGLLFVIPRTHKMAYDIDYDAVLDQNPELLTLLRDAARKGYTADESLKFCVPIAESHRKKVHAEMEGKERVVLQMKKGDTVIFSPGLIHGSLLPADPSLTRKFLLVEWATRRTQFFPPTAYFGPRHDFRRPENALSRIIEESEWGLMLKRPRGATQEQAVGPMIFD